MVAIAVRKSPHRNRYALNRNEPVGRPIEETNPIEDSVMPDNQLALVTGASTGNCRRIRL